MYLLLVNVFLHGKCMYCWYVVGKCVVGVLLVSVLLVKFVVGKCCW